MSRDELHQMMLVTGRTPDTFRRDTGMILGLLDNFEKVNRDLKRRYAEKVDQQIDFDEGADITDGAKDDEK